MNVAKSYWCLTLVNKVEFVDGLVHLGEEKGEVCQSIGPEENSFDWAGVVMDVNWVQSVAGKQNVVLWESGIE